MSGRLPPKEKLAAFLNGFICVRLLLEHAVFADSFAFSPFLLDGVG